ncbi:MAG TPA: hypothetical protein VJ768_03500, partial [Anaerolineales bacterium]|nr:hypothetical protein [Anaerolineales bacterium]
MSETVGRSEVRPINADDSSLSSMVETIADQIERLDADVQAFVPEPGRRGRLLGEAERLRDRFPDPTSRPSLFGLMVGVKDIFHVDGLPTRAGSSIPPDALKGQEGWAV